MAPNDAGVKERVTSSHTILLYLSDDFTEGATRFFPSGNYDDPAEAVDIRHVICTLEKCKQTTLALVIDRISETSVNFKFN